MITSFNASPLRQFPLRRIAAASFCFFGIPLVACASDPTFGEQVAAVSGEWEEGQRQIERGEKLVKEGRDDIADGEKRRNKAIAESRRLEEKRTTFRDDLARLQPVEEGARQSAPERLPDQTAMDTLQKRIGEIEKEIAAAVKNRRRGEDEIKEGRARIARGEKAIQEGKAKQRRAEADYLDVGTSR